LYSITRRTKCDNKRSKTRHKDGQTKMYMSCSTPCHECLKEIINAGIEEVICTSLDRYDEASAYLIENSVLKIRTFAVKSEDNDGT